jgi:enterochelin esterase-like enzyme
MSSRARRPWWGSRVTSGAGVGAALLVGAVPTVLAQTATPADTPRVVVRSLTSRIFGNTRAIRVYLPPGYDDAASAGQRYPLIYFNDGFAVFSQRGWNAPRTVDSLIRAGVIPPMVVVGIDNAASIPGAAKPARDRANEFLPYPDSTEPDLPSPRGLDYPTFVVEEVMPFIARSFRVLEGSANTGIAGSSYGGIAALVAVQRRQGVFGTLLLESTPLFLFRERLLDDATRAKVWPRAVYLGIGTREVDDQQMLAAGDRTRAKLAGIILGSSPRTRLYHEVAEGATHTSRAWAARLPAALTFLYGTPKP